MTADFSQHLDVSKPLILFRIPILLTSVVMMVGAVVILSGGVRGFEVAAVGPEGTRLTSSLQGRQSLYVYTDVLDKGLIKCRDTAGHQIGAITGYPVGDRVVAGTKWYGTSWNILLAKGESVSCDADAAGQILLGHRSGLGRLVKGFIFGATGLFGAVMGAVGIRLNRRMQQGPQQDPSRNRS